MIGFIRRLLLGRPFLKRSSMEIEDFLNSINVIEDYAKIKIDKQKMLYDFLNFKINDTSSINNYIIKRGR